MFYWHQNGFCCFKAVNNMKVQNRNVDLLHENIKILQNELDQKNEFIKSHMEIQSTVFDSLSTGRNSQTFSDQQPQQQQQQQSQQFLEHKQTMYEQHHTINQITTKSITTRSTQLKYTSTATTTATATTKSLPLKDTAKTSRI